MWQNNKGKAMNGECRFRQIEKGRETKLGAMILDVTDEGGDLKVEGLLVP